MAILAVSPTRMELSRIKKRLVVAVKGHKLLKDKRDELMRQFLLLIKETKELRQKTEDKLTVINQGFAIAGSLMRKEALAAALLLPKQSVQLSITSKNIMGVDVPIFDLVFESAEQGAALSYGYAFTSGQLDDSIMSLAATLPDLLKLAEQEKTLQMLAAEIERTRRRVNALEYIMIPDYQDTIRHITMKLDENERSNLTRLMKVKDMMVAKQLQLRRLQDEAMAE